MTKKKTKQRKKSSIGIIERFDQPFEYLGVLQLLFMAGSYAYLWFSATETDAIRVYAYSLLMVFEFVMVHSGIFMTFFPRKISLLIFSPFYAIFALMFNMMLGGADNTILILYLTTVFNRMRFAFSDKSKEFINRNIAQSVFATAIYFFLVFFVLIFDFIIPEFALNEAFYKSEAYLNAKKAKGMFVDTPYSGIALGTLYFSLLACFNFYITRKRTFE